MDEAYLRGMGRMHKWHVEKEHMRKTNVDLDVHHIGYQSADQRPVLVVRVREIQC